MSKTRNPEVQNLSEKEALCEETKSPELEFDAFDAEDPYTCA